MPQRPASRIPRSARAGSVLAVLASLLVLATLVPAGALAAQDALFPVEIDEDENRILLTIPEGRLGQEVLYMNTLATGLGLSGPTVDRGQVGMEAVVYFERRGQRVLMMRDNWSVRAPGGSDAEVRAAKESFPISVIASFEIESDSNGDLTVDASSFFFSDVFGVSRRVGGSTSVSRDRSWIHPEFTGSYPTNTEVRAVLTFTSNSPPGALNQAAPDGSAATFQQHHSFVELPAAEGFRPRAFDSRAGLFSTSFYDFTEGIDGDHRDRYANRWRLVPSDPEAYLAGELVEPVEPIIYYLDPGIPEPYYSAFKEGGNWWNGIFEAAGFRNAFEVRDLPDGVDPLDARYNVLYWVNRTGPGPSVGPSYRDPRTGEILKTVIRMDSHRSLVDYNIWAGLRPAAGPGGPNVDAETFTMARRRQHTAHEIGHTLGIAHNFISASQDRASVMDYPAPLIRLGDDGEPDLSDAYRDSGGAWDSLAVRYAYTWYPDEASERQGLAQIVEDALDQGLRFITGGDAGSSGSIPAATQWVEGATMFDAVERTSDVRELLVESFDETAIDPGEPMSMLNMRFAHVYLHHRYALEGLVKYVGGMDFTYALRGDGQTPARILPAAEQRRALEMALDALEPDELAIPDRINDLIPPTPYGVDNSATWIGTPAGTAFDPITLAGGLATEVIGNLLNRQRLARLSIFHARDPDNPSVHEVLGRIVERSWGRTPSASPGMRALERAVERVVLDELLDRAGDSQATPEVRAAAAHQIAELADRIEGMPGSSAEDQAHRAMALRDIEHFDAGRDDPSARPRFPVIPLPWP